MGIGQKQNCLSMEQKQQQDELLCTYAALILHDDGASITAEKMQTLIKAAGCQVEAYWPMLFSRMIASVGMTNLIAMSAGACSTSGGFAEGPLVGTAGGTGVEQNGAGTKEVKVEE